VKPRRRYLTFSLRFLFVLTTALAVWLGVIVNRAREQREAVKAIEALGGTVQYDWAIRTVEPVGPAWLRRIVGDDYFQKVRKVAFGFDPSLSSKPVVLKAVPYLKRLRDLDTLSIFLREPIPIETENEVKAALPDCDVSFYR